jgi:hypothetical protein
MRTLGLFIVSATLSGAGLVRAQGSHNDYVEDPSNVKVDPSMLSALKFRDVGFARGGRSTAVTGVPGQPLVYYFGGTGGGVFKTVDAGNNWTNVTDGFLGVGAIGAIAVAPSSSIRTTLEDRSPTTAPESRCTTPCSRSRNLLTPGDSSGWAPTTAASIFRGTGGKAGKRSRPRTCLREQR